MNSQTFALNKNFCGKNFEVIDNPRNYLLHVRRTWRQDVRLLSVIRRHHNYTEIFYAHAPLERHCKAEENPTMTLLSLAWPDPSLRRVLSLAGAYTAIDKYPARI